MSAGRLRVQVPSDPPFSRSVAQSLERAAWAREVAGENPAVPTNLNFAAVVEYIRHPPSKRNDAGGSPAGSANYPLPGSVKVARRPVKPFGVGASPTLAAICGRQADISWLHLSRKQGP